MIEKTNEREEKRVCFVRLQLTFPETVLYLRLVYRLFAVNKNVLPLSCVFQIPFGIPTLSNLLNYKKSPKIYGFFLLVSIPGFNWYIPLTLLRQASNFTFEQRGEKYRDCVLYILREEHKKRAREGMRENVGKKYTIIM